MLRPGPRSLAPALAVLALGVAGCGSEVEKTIPPDNADAMLGLLDQVETSAEAGNCQLAENGVSQLMDAVNDLPADVGEDTKDDLRRLVDNLGNLVDDAPECQETVTGATGPQGATDPPPEAPTTASTTPPPEEDTPPEQEEEEGDGLDPGNSDNGPPGPSGNPNEGDSGSDDGGTGSGGIGDD